MYISVGMFILFVCQKRQSAESRVFRIPDVFLLVPMCLTLEDDFVNTFTLTYVDPKK